MENNLKKEFEVYLKHLTTAVCKEIYLEDIKKETENFQELLTEYKRVIEKQEEQMEKNEKKNRLVVILLVFSVINFLLESGILLYLFLN